MIENERRGAAEEPMSFTPSIIFRFRNALLAWYTAGKRDLPWRRTRDPYAIWLSEIMLQQTRVAAVIPYFERFLSRFPDFEALAAAPEADLLSAWSGLGYYHRARNLQKAARKMRELGAFPADYASIRDLPGIGDYTAAAVASIGFDLCHAAVDGNVLRVVSRLTNDSTDIATPASKRQLTVVAELLLDGDRPGDHNQAMMELGATVCLPRNPQCLVCPVAEFCQARAAGTQDTLPVKHKKARQAEELRTVLWIEHGGQLLVWQRAHTERLMPGFWELPEPEHLSGIKVLDLVGSFRHAITVHNYHFNVCRASAPDEPLNCQWIERSQLHSLPISSIFRKALRLVESRKFPSSTVPALAESAAAR